MIATLLPEVGLLPAIAAPAATALAAALVLLVDAALRTPGRQSGAPAPGRRTHPDVRTPPSDTHAARLGRAIAAVTTLGLAAALVGALLAARRPGVVGPFGGGSAWSSAWPTAPLQVAVLAAAAVVAGLVLTDGGPAVGERMFLVLCGTTGVLTLAGARDLVLLVVALETTTLPAIALVAVGRTRRAAGAAVTMLVPAVLGTAAALLGAAVLYAATGAVTFAGIAEALTSGVAPVGPPVSAALDAASAGAGAATTVPVDARLAAIGAGLLLVGLAFKAAAVPLHAWAPDTYAGAGLATTAYLATLSKAAGVIGAVGVLGVAAPTTAPAVGPLVAAMAVASMVLGAAGTVRSALPAPGRPHPRVLRLLAWSGIAHSGAMLAPLALATPRPDATVRYLCLYLVVSASTLAVLGAADARSRRASAGMPGGTDAASAVGADDGTVDVAGLLHRDPVLGAAFLLAVAALAGLPPGLAGLWAKLSVFSALVGGGASWVAVALAASTVLAAAGYAIWVLPALRRAPAAPARAADDASAKPDANVPAPSATAGPAHADGTHPAPADREHPAPSPGVVGERPERSAPGARTATRTAPTPASRSARRTTARGTAARDALALAAGLLLLVVSLAPDLLLRLGS